MKNKTEVKAWIVRCPYCGRELEVVDSINGNIQIEDLEFCILCGGSL